MNFPHCPDICFLTKKISLTSFHIREEGIFCFELRESFISKNKSSSLVPLPRPEVTSIVINHDESFSLVRFSSRVSGEHVHVDIAGERLRISSGGCFHE